MQINNYMKNKLSLFLAISFGFILTSCGSYQYVGYSSDGIYDDEVVVYEDASSATEVEPSSTNSNSYYKHYFNEKANQQIQC